MLEKDLEDVENQIRDLLTKLPVSHGQGAVPCRSDDCQICSEIYSLEQLRVLLEFDKRTAHF